MTYTLARMAADLAAMRGLGEETLPQLEALLAFTAEGVARKVLAEALAEDPDGSFPDCSRSMRGSLFRLPESPDVGQVPLPEDFMHLLCFRMEGWSVGVTRLIGPSDPDYALCKSEWPEVAGTPQTPRCYRVRTAGGDRLEFHSAPPEARCLEAVYLAAPTLRQGSLVIEDFLYPEVLSRLPLPQSLPQY